MRDAGHRTPDAGRRTSDGEKSKNNISTPQGGGHKYLVSSISIIFLNIVDLPLTTQLLNGRKLENGCLHISRRLLPYHQH